MDPLARPSEEDQERSFSRSASTAAVDSILARLRSGSSDRRIEAAREVRRLTKTSSRNRRRLADAIEPVVSLLRSGSAEDAEAALPALLNLAVKDESNKIKIIDAGALDPLVAFLQSPNPNLQENATATLLTLSASSANKPVIASTAAVPRLTELLRSGSPQAKADAVAALSNLSALPEALQDILLSRPVPRLLDLLKASKKSSRTAEKCTSLLEPLLASDEARAALAAEPGGVLAVVEAVEDGSPRTREHAVGALLALCRSDRRKYRDAILNEGAIPGLLELTVQGTEKARAGARELLELLRGDSSGRRSEREEGETLGHVVTDIVWRIDGEDRSGKAKRMLEEMVRVSMEESLRHLEQRAALMHAPAAEL
ncbi:U-box domain-containing protein 4 isoform X1 [Iris pallida]|uniref:U-box domain-containing protein 4 isoform X1 n=1 Tax=Iris pallida TaxID=29817 RepID=A0AAX6F2A8_IRIPA|nr:U-box domain-containing protein 4 isoform X1 [Iris pallida]